jgi:hypothetical protein
VAAVVALSSNHNQAISGGPSAGPTPTSTPYIIFFDPLTSAKYEWPNDSHCAFASDGYHVIGDYSCYAPTGDLDDGAISVDVKQISGADNHFYGLALRRASAGNRYDFVITSNGYWTFDKSVNNKFTDILPYVPTQAIHTGLNATNTLKVVAHLTHFTFFINGVQVGQADDTTYSAGLAGVVGHVSSEFVFTNFTVAQLG